MVTSKALVIANVIKMAPLLSLLGKLKIKIKKNLKI